MAALECKSGQAMPAGAAFLTAATAREWRDAPIVNHCHAGQGACSQPYAAVCGATASEGTCHVQNPFS